MPVCLFLCVFARPSGAVVAHRPRSPRFSSSRPAVLPIMMEYMQSGYLSCRMKLVDSLRVNMRFYMFAGIGCVAAFLLLVVFGGGLNIFHFLMAAGNTYGLLLVVLLLGYGLVSIPRSMLSRSCPEKELTRRYLLASTVDSDLYDAVWALQDVEECIEKVLARRSSTNNNEVLAYLTALQNGVEEGSSLDLMAYGGSDLKSRRTRNGGRR